MTDYLILRRTEQEGGTTNTWKLDNVIVRANSRRGALAAAGVKEGTYVAVPARSWKPLTVSVEQTTKVTIG